MDVIIDQMFDVSSEVVRIKKFISSGKRIEAFSTDTEIIELRPCPEKIEEVVNSGVSGAKCRLKFVQISYEYPAIFCALNQLQKVMTVKKFEKCTIMESTHIR